MRNLLSVTFVSLLLLISSGSNVLAAASVGKEAPAFSLPGSDGKTHSLAEAKGKFVVLEWLNPECPFVRKHYDTGNMQALQKKYTEKGVLWFSVNSSAPGKQGHLEADDALSLIERRSAAPSAILLDPDGKVGKLFGAHSTPHMFVINPEGTLIYAGAIDDNDSTRTSSVAGAKNYVAAALDEALAGRPVSVPSTDAYGCSVKYAS